MTTFESLIVPVLSVASYIVCLVLYCLDIRKRNPAALIWVGLAVLYVIPSFFDAGKSGYAAFQFGKLEFGPADIVKAQFYALCILLSILVVRLVVEKRVQDWTTFFDDVKVRSLSLTERFVYYVPFLVLLALVLLSYRAMVDSGQGMGWESRREVLTGLDVILMGLLFKLLAGFSLFWFLKRRYFDFVLQLLVYILAFFILGGSRFYVVIVLLPLLIYWMSSSNSVKRFLIVTSSYIILSTGMGVLRVLRFTPSLEGRLQLIMNPISTFSDVAKNFSGEGAVRFFYYAYVSGDAYMDSFFSLKYLIRTFLVFLPSAIAPFKPENFEYDMHYAASEKVATMHPTLFGAIYADSKFLGLFWVFLIMFYFYIFPSLFKVKRSVSLIIIYGAICSSSLMLARGAIYGSIFGIFVLVLVVYLLERASLLRVRK
jgi:hypothetical protein